METYITWYDEPLCTSITQLQNYLMPIMSPSAFGNVGSLKQMPGKVFQAWGSFHSFVSCEASCYFTHLCPSECPASTFLFSILVLQAHF